jgi:hypothetical protein
MARSSMTELIARVRLAIGDPSGAAQTFTDDHLQMFLDARRVLARYWRLEAHPDNALASPQYLLYTSLYQNWESDGKLYTADNVEITPAASDWLNGQWTMATSTLPPVYIVGKVYDVNAAAADALEAWAAALATEFDFSAQGESFSRSQKSKRLFELAQQFRVRQFPLTVEQARLDLE